MLSGSGRWFLSASSLMLAACAEPESVTQVIVLMTTDYSWPNEANLIRAEVRNSHEDVQGFFEFSLGDEIGQYTLPNSFAIVPRDDSDPSFTVDIELFAPSGEARVRQLAETDFIRGKTAVLEMPLLRSCESQYEMCTGDQTCRDGTCVPKRILPSELRIIDCDGCEFDSIEVEP